MGIREAIKEVGKSMEKAIESTKREFLEIRSGRANPKMIEGVRVNYYGTPTLLKEIATIGVPEARMLVVSPYDPSSLAEIEKAVLKADLGITPTNNGKVIRLIVPPLSEERRHELIKIAGKLSEEGKVSIRTIRRNGREKIKSLEKSREISEDDKYKAEEELQNLTDSYIKKLDKLLEEKEKELKEF